MEYILPNTDIPLNAGWIAAIMVYSAFKDTSSPFIFVYVFGILYVSCRKWVNVFERMNLFFLLMWLICIDLVSDPMACIMGRISVHRPKKRIIDKLIELGLVHDRKQLYKKRGAKSSE